MSDPPRRPSLVSVRRWQARRDHYLAVFERALDLLRECSDLPEDEPNLTRELWFKLTTATRELDPRGRFGHPLSQMDNLPDPDSANIQPYEVKRPDFQWIHDDSSEVDDRKAMKSFAIECKRLGEKTRSGWDLNFQYVAGGIRRFHSPDWKYGHNMAEGAMIGFVQNMDMEAIALIVDSGSVGMGYGSVTRERRGWQEKGVSYLASSFSRGFAVSPFRLIHLWLDIRDIVQRPRRQVPKRVPVRKQMTPKKVKIASGQR